MASRIDDVLNDKASQHETEDGGDVSNGAITFVVSIDRQTIGTHHRLVFQKFIGTDALEFAGRVLTLMLEALTESTCQWVALNLPELRRFDTCWGKLQGCTHQRVELSPPLIPLTGGKTRSHKDKQRLVLQ